MGKLKEWKVYCEEVLGRCLRTHHSKMQLWEFRKIFDSCIQLSAPLSVLASCYWTQQLKSSAAQIKSVWKDLKTLIWEFSGSIPAWTTALSVDCLSERCQFSSRGLIKALIPLLVWVQIQWQPRYFNNSPTNACLRQCVMNKNKKIYIYLAKLGISTLLYYLVGVSPPACVVCQFVTLATSSIWMHKKKKIQWWLC